MPETPPPVTETSGLRLSPVRVAANGLSVACPQWEGVPGLVHGTTTRQALPDAGKLDFFRALAQARAAGALPAMWTVGGEQVHGTGLEVIERPLEPRDHPLGYRHDDTLGAGEFAATDALITTMPGVLLVIQTADCLPVFLLDRKQRMCGLAHCGWRGLYGGLAGRLARRMIELGTVASDLEAWLGPAICAQNYEVGPELAQKFAEVFPGAGVGPDARHLDLAALARHQLEGAGLSPESIADSGECTRAREDRYHSYRGQGERAGRMLSFIGYAAA